MKVYCGRNRKGVWKASLDESKVFKFDNVFECEVDVIHNNKLYMIEIYHGFDYNYYSESNPIYNDTKYVFQLYHSVSAAKKNDVWKEKEKLYKENPTQYHVTPFSIASDYYGEPFVYGDVMENKFNMQIIGIKVI